MLNGVDHPFLVALAILARDLGYEVEISWGGITDAHQRGVTLYHQGQIHLAPGQGELDYFAILVHELGHVLLHSDEERRSAMKKPALEGEADAVVRLVLDMRSDDPVLSKLKAGFIRVFEPTEQETSAASKIAARLPSGPFYRLPA